MVLAEMVVLWVGGLLLLGFLGFFVIVLALVARVMRRIFSVFSRASRVQPAGMGGVADDVGRMCGAARCGYVNPGNGTSDSNRRSIALSASIGSGQSVVYYFDTLANRLCVYQYSPGKRGGLRLLAARLIDYDLRLESYRDLSEKTPGQMRRAYESAMQEGPGGKKNLPTRRFEFRAGNK